VPSNTKEILGPSGHRKRLRDRFAKSGRSALADYELLELLLTFAIPRIDTKPIAKNLLHQFGSILGVLQQPEHRLIHVNGIGKQTALFFKVIHGCLTRCMEIEVETQPSISGPEDIFAFVRLHLGMRENEYVYALYLDNANHIIHHCDVASGTVDKSSLYPREVLKPALIHNATSVVLVHNHPAGQPIPSEQDLTMTRKIEEIAKPLGVKLLDHLIVTRKQAYSIKTGKLI
jgi:DNA repair protein RadC